jgi:hypothetical protein
VLEQFTGGVGPCANAGHEHSSATTKQIGDSVRRMNTLLCNV